MLRRPPCSERPQVFGAKAFFPMETVATIFLALCALLFLAGVIFIAATWKPEKRVEELAPRWAKPPSKFISAGGMQVHLRDEGPPDDPSPIVLLHGTGSSLHAWDGWAAALREHRRVIRYDMAGFGLTGPSPDGIYNVDRDVELLVSILDALGVQRCILGGNSLGGTVAWRAALAHPERASRAHTCRRGWLWYTCAVEPNRHEASWDPWNQPAFAKHFAPLSRRARLSQRFWRSE